MKNNYTGPGLDHTISTILVACFKEKNLSVDQAHAKAREKFDEGKAVFLKVVESESETYGGMIKGIYELKKWASAL